MKFGRGDVLAVFLVFELLPFLQAADWPRLGGPNGSYVSPETGLARRWPTNGPHTLWTVEVGEGFAGPAIRDGQVYLLDRPDQRQDLLRCFDLDSGKELWRLSFETPGKLPFPGSRNTPTVDERWIFVVSPFGQFSCVDRQSHGIVWSKHLVNDFKDPEIDRPEAPTNRLDKLARAQVPMWGLTQAPLLYRDLVIVAPQTQRVGLVACEKSTGRIRWQSDYLGRNWYSHISPVLARLGGVDQIIMLAQPSDPEKSPEKAPPALISSVDPNSGKILWMTETPGPHKIPIPQPLPIDEDRLFITGGYTMGSLLLEVLRDNQTWKTKVKSQTKAVAAHIHSPVLHGDRIYVSSSKEQGAKLTGLVCLDKNGQPLWQTGPELTFQDGSLLLVDGMALAMNGRTGHLHLLELTPNGCRQLASAKILEGRNLWAPMALSQGKLVLRDQKEMKCLDLSPYGTVTRQRACEYSGGFRLIISMD